MKSFKEIMEEKRIPHVKMSYSLLLRMFEYFREEETDDVKLHDITERISKLDSKMLTMDDYDFIVGNKNK